jgi:hypothetical protein
VSTTHLSAEFLSLAVILAPPLNKEWDRHEVVKKRYTAITLSTFACMAGLGWAVFSGADAYTTFQVSCLCCI